MFSPLPDYKRKTPEDIIREIEKMKRGKLKLFIGSAPGVGKSYRMLHEAHELRKENVDVVIGLIETHNRTQTIEQIKDLEVIPLKTIEYKGRQLKELDVDAIKRRNPDVVIIDELAHTNVPGSNNKKRYQDIQNILDVGISVLSAVNIQHIESVHDIVGRITGVSVRERVPDWILHAAHEIVLVDVSPETLQQRLMDGKIYAKEKIEQSLHHFFTLRNLGALRELALREIANDVDDRIEKGESQIGVAEKILVCVQYKGSAERLIRRGARMAKRLKADLYVLNVLSSDKAALIASERKRVRSWRKLSEEFGATFLIERTKGKKVPDVLCDVILAHHITHIVLGQSARTRWEEVWKGSIVNTIMRMTENVDIHIVADERKPK
ncbi:KdpD-like non-kinase potassium sensor [Alkalihalobacterium bogoriense]|uniref:KdpD-like non-kinase potassium sensor n=1 Tax=Alkalihalobacterium bogoriense TaxID=246272 RepID=UPI00047EDA15|nr:KdpD-like non-kinase potassium sensor [Alkalihalobacterium bogoriense]